METELLKEIFTGINILNQKIEIIMTTLADIRAEFETLKTTVNEERAQANTKLDELLGKIDELTTNIQNGGTEEERAALLADVKNLTVEVKSIIPDAEQPDDEEEGEGGEEATDNNGNNF